MRFSTSNRAGFGWHQRGLPALLCLLSLLGTTGFATGVFSPVLTRMSNSNVATVATSLSAASPTTVCNVTAISAQRCTGSGSGTVVINANPTASGPAFGASTNVMVTGGTASFTGIANPTQPQAYAVRLCGVGSCATDVTLTTDPAICQRAVPKCVPVVITKIR